MTQMNRFAELSASAMSLAQDFTKAAIELSQEQRQLVDSFSKAREALKGMIVKANEGKQTAISQITEAFNTQRDGYNKQIEELTKAFDQECVAVGLRKEDVPLADYAIFKGADKAAKFGLGLFGKAKAYVNNAVKAGEKS
jgi:vacuolar-type H+-ATPase subunit E/Vma4